MTLGIDKWRQQRRHHAARRPRHVPQLGVTPGVFSSSASLVGDGWAAAGGQKMTALLKHGRHSALSQWQDRAREDAGAGSTARGRTNTIAQHSVHYAIS